jgi:hypothetical protein
VLAGGVMVASRAMPSFSWLSDVVAGSANFCHWSRVCDRNGVWAKASTVGGNGGGALAVSLSLLRAPLRDPFLAAWGSQGENPVPCGRAATSRWRRALLGGAVSGDLS